MVSIKKILDQLDRIEQSMNLVAAQKEDLKQLLVKERVVSARLRRELLKLKGPCTDGGCSLHLNHEGPCDG